MKHTHLPAAVCESTGSMFLPCSVSREDTQGHALRLAAGTTSPSDTGTHPEHLCWPQRPVGSQCSCLCREEDGVCVQTHMQLLPTC